MAILSVGLQARDHMCYRQELLRQPCQHHTSPGDCRSAERSVWLEYEMEPDLANTNTPTLPPFREHPLSTQSASLPRRQHYTTRKTVKSQREVVGETSRKNSRYLKKMASSFSGYWGGLTLLTGLKLCFLILRNDNILGSRTAFGKPSAWQHLHQFFPSKAVRHSILLR